MDWRRPIIPTGQSTTYGFITFSQIGARLPEPDDALTAVTVARPPHLPLMQRYGADPLVPEPHEIVAIDHSAWAVRRCVPRASPGPGRGLANPQRFVAAYSGLRRAVNN